MTIQAEEGFIEQGKFKKGAQINEDLELYSNLNTKTSLDSALFKKDEEQIELFSITQNLQKKEENIIGIRHLIQELYNIEDDQLSLFLRNHDIQHIVGNAQIDMRLVRDQIYEKTAYYYLNKHSNDKEQMQALINNTKSLYQNTSLTFGKKLDSVQEKNLMQDIILPVVEMIEGKAVLVPKLYLSTATKSHIFSGYEEIDFKRKNRHSLMSAKNIKIKAQGLINKSNILAQEKLAVNLSHYLSKKSISLINQGGLLEGGSIEIHSSGDILNKSIEIEKISTETNNGNWNQHFAREQIDLRKTSSIWSTKDTGKLNINTKNTGDILLEGTSFLYSRGELNLKSNQNIYFSSIALNQHSKEKDKIKTNNCYLSNCTKSIEITDKKNYSQSHLGTKTIALRNINLEAQGEIGRISSYIKTERDLEIKAKKGYQELLDFDTEWEYTDKKKKIRKMLSIQTKHEIHDSFKQNAVVNSTYVQENMSLESGRDITIIAPLYKIGGNLTISTLLERNDSTKNAGNISILSARNISKTQSKEFNESRKIQLSWNKPLFQEKSNKILKQEEQHTQELAKFQIGGHLNIKSSKNILLQGIEFIANKDIAFQAQKDINIESTKDIFTSKEESFSKQTNLLSLFKGDGLGWYFDSKNIKIGYNLANHNENFLEKDMKSMHVMKSKLLSGRNIQIQSGQNINLLTVEIHNTGNTLLHAQEDIQILSQKDSNEGKYSNTNKNIQVSLELGNAYVDLGNSLTHRSKGMKDTLVDVKEIYNETKKNDYLLLQLGVGAYQTWQYFKNINKSMDLFKIFTQFKDQFKAIKSAGSYGFYVDGNIHFSLRKENSVWNEEEIVDSNLQAGKDLQIKSQLGRITLQGSSIVSLLGNIELESKKAIAIQSGIASSYEKSSQLNLETNLTLGQNPDFAVDILQSQTKVLTKTHKISQLIAKQGNISLNSKKIKIHGGEILSKQISIQSQEDIILKTVQNKVDKKNRQYGLTLGIIGTPKFKEGIKGTKFGASFNILDEKSLLSPQLTSIQAESGTIHAKKNLILEGALIHKGSLQIKANQILSSSLMEYNKRHSSKANYHYNSRDSLHSFSYTQSFANNQRDFSIKKILHSVIDMDASNANNANNVIQNSYIQPNLKYSLKEQYETIEDLKFGRIHTGKIEIYNNEGTILKDYLQKWKNLIRDNFKDVLRKTKFYSS